MEAVRLQSEGLLLQPPLDFVNESHGQGAKYTAALEKQGHSTEVERVDGFGM